MRVEQIATSVGKCGARRSRGELQRKLSKAKFSSPKPPRASDKTSGFMKVRRVLAGEGAGAWPRPSPPARVVSCGAPGARVPVGFLLPSLPLLRADQTLSPSHGCSSAPAVAGGPTPGVLGGLCPLQCGNGREGLREGQSSVVEAQPTRPPARPTWQSVSFRALTSPLL